MDGSGLLSDSGLRLVESPRLGVGLLESFPLAVWGLERVPRTEVEWVVFTIVAGSDGLRCMGWVMMFDGRKSGEEVMGE